MMVETTFVPVYTTESYPVMSDVEQRPRPPPQQRQQRPMPQTTMQLAGHATTEVVESVGKTPLMLGVILLNVVGIAAAVYFLNILIMGQQNHLKSLLEVQNQQQTEIITMHQREFDALLDMARTNLSYGPLPSSPIPSTTTPPVVTPLPRPQR